jgi:hypothetical protein
MEAFLYAIPSWLLFLLIVGGSVGLVWLATVLLRRVTTAPKDDRHNEVVGFIFATVGVLYAVLLAFTVIIVWEQYLGAESAVSQEGTALITVARTASSFPEPERGQVYDHLRAYAQFVINEEWRTMDEPTLEQEESAGAEASINSIWSTYRSLPPSQVDAYTTESLDNLSTQRALRLQSNAAALPIALWFGLVLGELVTISFCLILHMENVQLHALVTALLTALIATSIWMIVMINHPFSGDLHVSTAAFEHAIHVIESLPR